MATIQELLGYLERGYTLQSVRGETIRPFHGNMVLWMKTKGYRFQEEEKYTLAQMSSMHDMWDWGVLFCDQRGKNLFIETEIAKIEELIARGIPGAAYASPE